MRILQASINSVFGTHLHYAPRQPARRSPSLPRCSSPVFIPLLVLHLRHPQPCPREVVSMDHDDKALLFIDTV